MEIKRVIQGVLWFLHEARTFSPVKLYRWIRDYPDRPRLFEVQFRTRKKEPLPPPVMIDDGLLNVPFSALDNHGIIKSEPRKEVEYEEKPSFKEKIKLSFKKTEMLASEPEEAPEEPPEKIQGTALQEQLLRETVGSIEHPDPDFPTLDCIDLHYKFTIVGIRNGHMHLLAKNALGKTFKATVHDVFDAKGRLKVKGVHLRVPLRASVASATPIYRKAGVIDLTGYVGLTAHTLAQLEDALNAGLTKIRRLETEPAPKEAAGEVRKAHSTLSMLKNIRSLLSRQKGQERRNYTDRRAGDDRRLEMERRDELERRSGIDRRKAREEAMKSLMLVKDEEYRKEERRKEERRAGLDRRQTNERRKSLERRKELHITVERRQYVRGEQQALLALITDKWNTTEKVEGEEIILNPRGEVPMVHLYLDNPGGRLGIQGQKGAVTETFITPLVSMPTLIRSTTDVMLHLSNTSKGFLRFKPKKKTESSISILLPQSMLATVMVDISSKGRRKLTLGLLSLEISKLHKECMLMTPEGKQFMLNNPSDATRLETAIRTKGTTAQSA